MFVCQLKKIKRNDNVLVKRWLPEILYWGDQILQVDYLVPAFDSLGYEWFSRYFNLIIELKNASYIHVGIAS